MKRLFFLMFCSSLMVACTAQPALPVLSAQAYGAVRFGESLVETEARLQQNAVPEIRTESCSYITFAQYPDIRFMIENGIVTRADAGPDIVNTSGFAIGGDSAELAKANPQIKIMPHKYEPESHYLILAAPDQMSALVFEESGGRITKVRAGVEPSVEYVEGCG